MTYYGENQLALMGFRHIGKNVKISDKSCIYNADQIDIGDNSRIDDFCIISGNVKIGRYVHLAPMCILAGGEKGVQMDDFSGLAYHVQIFSQSDDYTGRSMTNPTVSAKFKQELKKPVYLGRHVIVGAGSIVFPGVEIAEGCSIGAMTLVNKSTKAWGVYFGNPARRIKERSKDLLVLEKQFLSENCV